MNRGHDAAQAKKCIQTAIECGITNLSADLIFGFPLLTDEKWKTNIDTLLQYPVQHISCYAMTIEPRTALHSMIAKKKLQAPDDEAAGRQYEYLIQRLMEAGYEHYEISNFAKNGYRAQHNSSYWKNAPYLGIGPSAHSYNGTARQWNISNNAQYIKKILQHEIPCETEHLNRTERINEKIMVSLRTSDGLPLPAFFETLNEKEQQIFNHKMNEFVDEQMLTIGDDECLRLSPKGKLFADGIAADLFF
jgi:oxygen-independent coproporphyrinogen-3 oxidase